MGWVDIVMLVVLAVSMAVGAWRGLVSQMLSLLGWVVAYFTAHWFAGDAAPHVPIGTPGSGLNLSAAYGVLFLLTLLVWGMLSWLVRQMVQASPLSGVDRLLGAVFGMARAVVIGLVATTLVTLTPLAQAQAWKESRCAAGLQVMLRGVRQLLPQEWLTLIPAALRGAQER